MSTVLAPTKWRLSYGCHRGTLVSRDSDSSECEDLAACKKLGAQIARDWVGMGVQVWYMTAYGPNGEQEKIMDGAPYR